MILCKIARVLSFMCVLNATLRGMKCDFWEQVESEVRKNLEKGVENLSIDSDKNLRLTAIQHLNYPVTYWNGNSDRLTKSHGCTQFPRPHLVQFENSYWQVYETSDGTFRLYNSYLDKRKLTGVPTVRILAMVNRKKPQVALNCLLWFNNSATPVIAKVSEYKLIWQPYWLKSRDTTTNLPFLINCVLPSTHQDEVPVAVTLAEQPCEQTWNVLKVIYEKPLMKEPFAVCVKGLDFPFWDMSLQLVEWIELCRLLGVNKIFFYNFAVHPRMQDVLDYYTRAGYVEVIPLTYSLGKPHSLRVANDFRDKVKEFEQVIAYNDCWNKNLYKYKHISLLDTDELIIPMTVQTWGELIEEIETSNQQKGGKKYASYASREARFGSGMVTLPEVPSYMTMMRRVLRSPLSKKGIQTKSIHDTEMVLTLHNHYFVDTFSGYRRFYEMDPSKAQLNHYRYCDLSNGKCPVMKLNNETIDVALWKYFKPLKTAIQEVIKNVESMKKIAVANNWLG